MTSLILGSNVVLGLVFPSSRSLTVGKIDDTTDPVLSISDLEFGGSWNGLANICWRHLTNTVNGGLVIWSCTSSATVSTTYLLAEAGCLHHTYAQSVRM